MNTLGIKLYFSENDDNDDDDDDYCQTDKTLNIGNIPEMLLNIMLSEKSKSGERN